MKTLATDHNLEQAIPFLVARAGARMGNSFAKALKPYGLSLTEWRVCASLLHTPNQTLSELSVYTSADISALSRLIDRLAAAELLRREKCGNDGRAVRIELTALGLDLTEQLVPLAQHFEAVALSDFSASEVKVLRAMLLRLYANATPLA